MIIRPDSGDPSVANAVEIVRVGSKRRIGVTLLDASGNPVDIEELNDGNGDPRGELDVDFTTLDGDVIIQDDFWPSADPATRRIKHSADGTYYFQLTPDDSGDLGTRVANWHGRVDTDTEDFYRTQVVEIVSPRVLSLLPRLRLQIDKSLKIVVPAEDCYLGYTDSMLVMFLTAGMEYINSFQPYVMWRHLDMFPIALNAEILIRAATYIALEAEMVFAIDTDIPSFSDQGKSFVLAHQQPLAAYVAQLKQELEGRVTNFKLHYVRSGTASMELRPDYAFSSMLSAAPWGSNFRGLYTAR